MPGDDGHIRIVGHIRAAERSVRRLRNKLWSLTDFPQCPVPAVPRQRIKITLYDAQQTFSASIPPGPSPAVQAARAHVASRLQHESWLRNQP